MADGSTVTAEHLASCQRCQGLLEELSDDVELRSIRLSEAHSMTLSLLASEPACRELVARLRSLDNTLDALISVGDTLVTDDLGLLDSEFSGDLGALGPYRILRELGRGGMAVVLEGLDSRLERSVAIKLLRPDRADVQGRGRFTREAQALAKVQHRNVISIYDVAFSESGLPYFVTELMSGGTLAEHIRGAAIDVRSAAKCLAAVADGLAAAHRLGLMHRDIKPSNILLQRTEDLDELSEAHSASLRASSNELTQLIPRLADFGLARSLTADIQLTQSQALFGTPAYMSPEQIVAPDRLTAATDIYSLGVTLYELLTGELPYRGSTQAVLQQIVEGDPPAPRRLHREIPVDLETICLKAMHVDPSRRYATAVELAEDLRRFLAGQPIAARPVGRAERVWRWVQRKPAQATQLAAIAALLLCLGMGAAASALWLNRAYQQAKKDAVRIEDERQAAEQAEQVAIEQRTLALDVLSDLVRGVQQELATRPATLSLRQSLLTTAFEGLQRVTESVDTARSTHLTVDALLQMSSIQNSLGNRESALELVARALEIAEQSVEREPADIEHVRNLANAVSNEGHLYREVFAYDDAEPRFERVVQLRKQIADAQTADPNNWYAWLASRQALLDLAIYRGDYRSAEVGFAALTQELVQLRERFPEAVVFLRGQVIANNRLAMVLAAGERADAAEGCLQMALKACEQLVERDRENVVYRGDLASVLVRLARTQLHRGEPLKGLAFARQGTDIYTDLAVQSPDDIQAQTLVGSAWHLQYELHLSAGDLAAALHAVGENIQIQRALVAKHPAASRYALLAAEASIAAADLQFRQGMLVEASGAADEAIAFLESAQRAADYAKASGVPKLLESYQTLRLAYDWVREGTDEILGKILAEPYAARVALALVLYTEARAGRLDTCPQKWLELVGDMASLPQEQQTQLLLALARCHLLAAGTRETPADQPLAMAVESTQRDVHLEHGLEYCERALAQMPTLREYFLKEPDFALLRQVEKWHDILGDSSRSRE